VSDAREHDDHEAESPPSKDAADPLAEPMIKVRDLTIGWGDITLMKDVTFDVAEGDIFVILGGSGCGKSTLLRHLIGLETAKGGTIEIRGLGAPEMRIEAPPHGVMFQSGALFGSMTLAENVALPLRRWTKLSARDIDTIVRDRLRLVSLDGFENHLPAEISGGMKKRAGIARALAMEPSLIFLDEPSAGLDPISAVELDDLILTLNRNLGMTTVLVTHELESIFKIAKNCVMLDKQAQGVIARGDPRWLRDHSDDERVTNFFNRRSPAGA
jgi:phospholipid/cholesterol/gamma-HCH transport system ATP-binding protein